MSRLLESAVLAFAALLLAATAANAQVYKWKDANGTIHYSDAPPATGANYQQVKLSSNTTMPVVAKPAPAASAGVAASASTAAAKPAAKIPDTADNRAKLCKDLGSNITLLSGSQPLTSGDAGANQQNMSDDQRRQELATARAQQQQYCTGG